MSTVFSLVSILLWVSLGVSARDLPQDNLEHGNYNDLISTLDRNSLPEFVALAKITLGQGVLQSSDQSRMKSDRLEHNRENVTISLMEKVYGCVRKLDKNATSIDSVVEAFVMAVSIDMHNWMPASAALSELEMQYGNKYVGTKEGEVTNLRSMQPRYEESWIKYDPLEDKETSDVVVKYKFDFLHMVFKQVVVYMWHIPVSGGLDLEFGHNEVEIWFDIPNFKYNGENYKIERNCFVTLKDIIVTSLDAPTAHLKSESNFMDKAERLVTRLARKNGDKVRLITELAIGKAMQKMMTAKHSWICGESELDQTVKDTLKNNEQLLAITQKDKFLKGLKVAYKGV